MKSDRKLTLDEVLRGDISEEYLDRKERKAVIDRRLRKLSSKRDGLRDKIELIGEREDVVQQLRSVLDEMKKLEQEREAL